MKWESTYSLTLAVLLLTACTAESLKDQLARQEQTIENYINRLIDKGSLQADSVFFNNGVYRLVFISGTGNEATSGDSVIFHYRARNFNTDVPYDSTGLYPEKGILGVGHYINGLEKGFLGMKTNEKAEILLTGEQAYGNMSVGILPPYTPVKFEILMLNVVKNN
ncbi:MAG: FKBP-type peptidyl-prolyl cis-trans isomerase [Prevotellaceae bacterium]|jgi:FKBP-type peptidyl-prolyl cis-trans isomerase|nr:FKBP-type peptidyl-prolyl cis-trans isomerase [Prevotellaceae bacterium]